MNKSKNIRIAWFTWFVAALFYSYEFIYRVSPDLMVRELMRDFQIDAANLGSLAAAYFYAYAICQIPAGFLFDRFNYKVILVPASIAVCLGGVSMSYSSSLLTAQVSRAIIGVGSAFAFIGCLRIAQSGLPNNQFPVMVGLTNMFGVIGATVAGAPLAWSVDAFGWRDAILYLSLIGLILPILLLTIPKHPDLGGKLNNKNGFEGVDANTQKNALQVCMRDVQSIIFCRRTWIISTYASLLVAPIVAFNELWGTPFISEMYELPKAIAASTNSTIFYGIAVGGPTIGWLAKHKIQPTKLMFGCTLGALLLLSLIIYTKSNPTVLTIYLFIYGAFTSNMLLCFSMIRNTHSHRISSLAVAFTNTIVMLSGAITQQLIGLALDLSWDGRLVDKLKVFNTSNYQEAFIILPIGLIIALILAYRMQHSNLASPIKEHTLE